VFAAAPAGFDPITSFEIEENYSISGSGVNFGLGLIYRPVDFIQVGASLVTPTFYQVTDNYDASVRSVWNDFDYYGDQSEMLNAVNERFDQPLISEYNLTTPMRLNTGATFIVSKMGFISADIEFVNYSKAKYTNDMSEGFEPENSDIKSTYESVINYRVGAEYRYEKFRVRGGFNYMNDPLVRNNTNLRQTGFSGGLGYRGKNFFIDLASIFTQANGRRVPYFVRDGQPSADQKFKTTSYMATIGFTF
jgi:hypothetical protein